MGPEAEAAALVVEALSSAASAFLITHQSADLDAVGACVALEELLGRLGVRRVRMGSGSPPSLAGRQLAERLGARLEVGPHDPSGLPVLVDVQNPAQVEPLVPWARPVVVDHHPWEGKADYAAALVDPSSPSTCELVLRLYERAGLTPARRAAFGLVAGIVSDTMSFRLARRTTFGDVASLLDVGGLDYQEVLESIQLEADRSARVANLKGAQRCELHPMGEWLIAVSRVNSFEADVAGSLVRLGADLAIVGARKKGGLRISLRARRTFIKGTGIHIAKDLLPRIEAIVQGSGGGHDAAASINGAANLDEGLEALLSVLRERIGDEGHGPREDPLPGGRDPR